jgi:hypothetical protein
MVSSQRLKACGAIGWALAFGLARQIGLPLHAAPVMTNRRQRG